MNTLNFSGKKNFLLKNSKTIKSYKGANKAKTNCSIGRNNEGKITVRHRGGGHKRLYRIIDYKRDKFNILGQLKEIVYDPNRNVKIALICYLDGDKRYILYPQNLCKYKYIISGTQAKTMLTSGNSLKLGDMPIGSHIHNISLQFQKGGQLVRSAGTSAKILAHKENFVVVRLPSTELRLINKKCFATLGMLEKPQRHKYFKAGQKRWLGIRPTVRGVAMNACDHPHGGGEGKSPIGRKTPLTPWGKIALGHKTRSSKLVSNKLIIKRKN